MVILIAIGLRSAALGVEIRKQGQEKNESFSPVTPIILGGCCGDGTSQNTAL